VIAVAVVTAIVAHKQQLKFFFIPSA